MTTKNMSQIYSTILNFVAQILKEGRSLISEIRNKWQILVLIFKTSHGHKEDDSQQMTKAWVLHRTHSCCPVYEWNKWRLFGCATTGWGILEDSQTSLNKLVSKNKKTDCRNHKPAIAFCRREQGFVCLGLWVWDGGRNLFSNEDWQREWPTI